EAPEYIYIIEIKKDDSAQAALDQIESKAYARRYAADQRKVFRIGVRFSTGTRAIEEWKVNE
ncbi:MAG: PD-(D/E)XK nuclease domain-containing protein, partial [Bacteroidales bacterium]|nr:PD-(D/E)XK nuclease domain-containing protein [Bacteroidales bacterium]